MGAATPAHGSPQVGWGPRRRGFLMLLIAFGGAAVLGSYTLVFAFAESVRGALWGGVPEALRPLYGVNMILAAIGFFPFTWRLVFRTDDAELRSAAGLPYATLLFAYALILVPSALWLPLTARMIEAPSTGLFVAVRAVLFAVALGSATILYAIWRLARSGGGALTWLGVVGAFFFSIQTVVLDALVWPAFFPLQ